MALMYSSMVPLGSKAPKFDLLGTDGNRYSLTSFNNSEALVVIFMCNHCPYVQSVLQRLINLHNDYKNKDVAFVGINPNDTTKYPDDSYENMKRLVAEKGISFPYLIDDSQKTAKAYDAICTPDIFVYGKNHTLFYRGRVDDNWKEPNHVTQEDLRNALELIISGKPVFSDQMPSIGCSIKWR